MEPEACFNIISREPVYGGHSSTHKERLRVADTETRGDGELSLFLKRTTATEVDALRAANRLPEATAIPPLVGSGQDSRGHWIVIPFYPGQPASSEAAIPENVAESLAVLHSYYIGSTAPEGIPVFDASWCRTMGQLPRLRQLASSRRALLPLIDRVASWSDHPVLLDTFAGQPRTLLHGDVHRNNVIVAGCIGRLVDWEGARYGMPMLDLITFGGPGSPGYERYSSVWRILTGEETASPAWRRGYLAATVCHKVGYLTFAARHFGDDHATKMVEDAARSLAELERLGRHITG